MVERTNSLRVPLPSSEVTNSLKLVEHSQITNMSSLDFTCSDIWLWKKTLSNYPTQIKTLTNSKPNLTTLDSFYLTTLPPLLHSRDPNPYITVDELRQLLQWKLTRGKFRPRLLSFVSSLTDDSVRSASQKAFLSLPDHKSSIEALTVLKGVGPATASAVLAAYSPQVAAFMSDEAMEAVVGDSKEYTLKRYLVFAEKVQEKAQELSSSHDQVFTPSDVERALWCSAVEIKLGTVDKDQGIAMDNKKKGKRKRKSN